MKKKVIEYAMVSITFVILINLFASNIIDIQEAAHYLDIDRVITLHMLSSLYIIIMGLLIERHLVAKMIATRKIALTPLFFIGLFMLIIGMLHTTFYMKIGVFSYYQPFPIGGFGVNLLLAPLYQGASVQHIITLLATIVLVRGLMGKNMDDTNR